MHIMKQLQASNRRPRRIIHVSIRGSNSTPKLSQTPTSHSTFNSNTISSYRNNVVLTLV